MLYDRLIDSSAEPQLVAKFVLENEKLLEGLLEFIEETEAKIMAKFMLPGKTIKIYDRDDFPLLTRLKSDYAYLLKELFDMRPMDNASGVYFILTVGKKK